MDHCSTKLAERNYPVSSVCVCVCVCVCVSVSKWCGFRWRNFDFNYCRREF